MREDGPPVGEESHPAGRRLGGYRSCGASDGPPGPPHRGTVESVAYPNPLRAIHLVWKP
jgi:hypothetical protein